MSDFYKLWFGVAFGVATGGSFLLVAVYAAYLMAV